MHAITQGLLNQPVTPRAFLGRVLGVYQHNRSASFCRFAYGHRDKLCPSHVQDAFSHPAAGTHPHLLRGKSFKGNDLVRSDQQAALLVGEVAAPVRYSLMDFRQQQFLLGVFFPVFACSENSRSQTLSNP